MYYSLHPIYADNENKIFEARLEGLLSTTIITTTSIVISSILESVFIRAVVILTVNTIPLIDLRQHSRPCRPSYHQVARSQHRTTIPSVLTHTTTNTHSRGSTGTHSLSSLLHHSLLTIASTHHSTSHHWLLTISTHHRLLTVSATTIALLMSIPSSSAHHSSAHTRS
jgi:hypothetical protein